MILRWIYITHRTVVYSLNGDEGTQSKEEMEAARQLNWYAYCGNNLFGFKAPPIIRQNKVYRDYYVLKLF